MKYLQLLPEVKFVIFVIGLIKLGKLSWWGIELVGNYNINEVQINSLNCD